MFASPLTVSLYPDRIRDPVGTRLTRRRCRPRYGAFRMAVVVRPQGSHQGKWVYSLGHRCALGRHAECDIADLFAENSAVSRFHALLECVEGSYLVEDTGSRNGTYLNGERLTGRVPLRSGDRLGIAGVELTFLEAADAAGPAAAPPAGAGPVY